MADNSVAFNKANDKFMKVFDTEILDEIFVSLEKTKLVRQKTIERMKSIREDNQKASQDAATAPENNIELGFYKARRLTCA